MGVKDLPDYLFSKEPKPKGSSPLVELEEISRAMSREPHSSPLTVFGFPLNQIPVEAGHPVYARIDLLTFKGGKLEVVKGIPSPTPEVVTVFGSTPIAEILVPYGSPATDLEVYHSRNRVKWFVGVVGVVEVDYWTSTTKFGL